MSKSSMEILHAEARALDPDRVALRLPFHVLVGEAVDVARFFERYYEEERAPKTKTLLRPGLSSIGHDRLPPSTADRLLALVDEVQAAQTDYQLAASAPEGDEDLARGRFVLSELTAALDFLFDDGVEDERDVQLLRVRRANDDTSSTDALAAALADYAGLAAHYRDELHGFGDFDGALIDEAASLADALRERSARGPSEAAVQAREALQWRNRLATLLTDEVARVRRAARFVFRHHPQIVREATSTYERRSRAARRRAAAQVATEAATSATS
ncbi:MAG: hypothetical protein H6712_26590 [Myxococcales bacterium]|nr:hypothetical protein [Myxococcales bacterium]MCB9717445.1 hypothetical protein [Myxococcales bacterium]